MIYLLILSFFVHFISIFAIVVLYQKIEASRPVDKDQTLKEMEDLLISYTTEMKDNNERIVRRLSKLNLEQTTSMESKKETGYSNMQRKPADQHPSEGTGKGVYFAKEQDGNGTKQEKQSTVEVDTYGNYTPPGIADESIQVNTSSTSRILSMHAQGYSQQEIAKKLQMGAGEVELLLKFHQ